MNTHFLTQEKITALEVRDIIEDCTSGNLARFRLLEDYPKNIVHEELEMAGVSQDTFEEWESDASLFVFIKDTYSDFDMVHPDETVEEFWDHED